MQEYQENNPEYMADYQKNYRLSEYGKRIRAALHIQKREN